MSYLPHNYLFREKNMLSVFQFPAGFLTLKYLLTENKLPKLGEKKNHSEPSKVAISSFQQILVSYKKYPSFC